MPRSRPQRAAKKSPSACPTASGATTASTSCRKHAAVTFRRFQPSDGPAVRALITGILATEYPQDRAAYPAADLAQLKTVYGGPRDAFFVAESAEGRVVGTCAVKAESPTTALLRRVFVHPRMRGCGLGGQLVELAIAHSRAQRFRRMRIRTADRMAAAIAVCQRKGFVEDERVALGPVQLIRFTLTL